MLYYYAFEEFIITVIWFIIDLFCMELHCAFLFLSMHIRALSYVIHRILKTYINQQHCHSIYLFTCYSWTKEVVAGIISSVKGRLKIVTHGIE